MSDITDSSFPILAKTLELIFASRIKSVFSSFYLSKASRAYHNRRSYATSILVVGFNHNTVKWKSKFQLDAGKKRELKISLYEIDFDPP